MTDCNNPLRLPVGCAILKTHRKETTLFNPTLYTPDQLVYARAVSTLGFDHMRTDIEEFVEGGDYLSAMTYFEANPLPVEEFDADLLLTILEAHGQLHEVLAHIARKVGVPEDVVVAFEATEGAYIESLEYDCEYA